MAEKRSAVRDMFDRIAPRYDLLNRLLTLGADQRWRRATLDAIAVGPGDVVVDLACGTGDLAELAARRGARTLGVDFARGMLHGAARRGIPATFVQGDGETLPLSGGCATAFTCGFALRNFISLPKIFAEAARVLAPGGRVALLDVDRPESPLLRGAHSFYFDRVVPRIGAAISDRRAYEYLPQSTTYLPPSAELLEMVARAGFRDVSRLAFGLGAVQLVTGVRG